MAKKKGQKDKQRSTKHTHKTKYRRKFNDLHRDLINRYGISVSVMTTDMFHLSLALPHPNDLQSMHIKLNIE
jgi:hypothetical protein